MTMKIENYTGTLDTFTWPYNPQAFDDTTDSNHTNTPLPYYKHHIIVSGGGIGIKNIILSGHFSGASKMTNWRDCSKHFMQTTQLKKLYFESDKFHIGIGKQIKRTHAGGRTNFIDYVATFESPIGVLFGNTEKTSGTNAGNTDTFVMEITGTVANGGVDVTIEDAKGNKITVPAGALTTGHSFKYELIKMVDSGQGIFVSEYGYVEVNGVEINRVRTTGGMGVLVIGPGVNVSTIATTNLNSVSVKFRDGYVD